MKKYALSSTILLVLIFSLSYYSYSQLDTSTYFFRGVNKGSLGDNKGAIQDFNKAIEINPKYEDAYYKRGATKGVLGDTNGACLDLSKAGELGYYDAYDVIKENCN